MFGSRIKIRKKRTTLVIDEEKVINKKIEEVFVDKKVTHNPSKNFEKIHPNTDPLKLNHCSDIIISEFLLF